MKIQIKYKGMIHNCEMYQGKPLADPPSSYKEVGIVSHNIGNAYNPSIAHLYKVEGGRNVLQIYRDGCFYPYYCPIYPNIV